MIKFVKIKDRMLLRQLPDTETSQQTGQQRLDRTLSSEEMESEEQFIFHAFEQKKRLSQK